MDTLLWKLHLGATLLMTGVILSVQFVQYPLFAQVGNSVAFLKYHSAHMQRITWVVGPLMILELVTQTLLLAKRPHDTTLWIGATLLLLAWLSTAFVQVPAHKRLQGGLDFSVHRWLVCSNWLRTVAWSARSALLLGSLNLSYG